jgi:undecaprenyl pyrophosphate phosphatase UppP
MCFAYFLTTALLYNLIVTTSAYAYIDPNTGGFFFQTIAPFVYGILAVIVVFWKRITGFVKGIFGRKKDQDSASQNE